MFDTISKVGLGTGTGFKKISSTRDKELVYVLQKAVDFGISFFDTAEIYFDGHAEIVIGKAFHNIRNKVHIATKFRPEYASYDNILRAAEGSLKRLNTDYIDLYQIHWPNPVVPIEESVKALEKLVESGKIKNIGVCNFSLRQLKDIKKASNLPIASVQTEYNLLERSVERDLLPYCQKNNITLIAYTPLNSGNILKTEKYSKIFHNLSEKYNKTPSQIILNFLISHQSVLTIPATTNISHLEENAKATDFSLDAVDYKLISKTFKTTIVHIDPKYIKVATIGDHSAYQTIKEALENKLNFFPSPKMLSEDIQKGDFLKPVKVKKLQTHKKPFEYELLGGRIRYWAWVIAFNGEKPIPAIIED